MSEQNIVPGTSLTLDQIRAQYSAAIVARDVAQSKLALLRAVNAGLVKELRRCEGEFMALRAIDGIDHSMALACIRAALAKTKA